MQVHREINNLPSFKNAAITIGTFDGVHTGHLQIIQQLKKEAKQNNGESVIITFDPHPRMILNPPKKQPPIKLLNTLSEKIELLEKKGIDHLVIVAFTLEFSHQSAEEYISDFLVSRFYPKTIIVGYDHRFGKNRTGDYKLLEQFQNQYNYEVKEIPEHVLHHVTISSTKIREALNEGDINTANEYLGYDYFFEGRVIDGNKLGRTLGYPTANLLINDANKLIPADGIYAVNVSIGKENMDTDLKFIAASNHKGMMSIGFRPTIGDNKKMIEVNIFDFDKDIYGSYLRIYVTHFMRKEERFDSLEKLVTQLAIDERNAKSLQNMPIEK
ncbi:MAG TPA: bifunctional riboflavin kinase/FAD synthetase [Hanamia sp.]|nr:bifunctional riboflavin kinase/FAD synthetase [Hanamia sp.]